MKNSLKISLLCLGASLGLMPALRADDTPPTPPPAAPNSPPPAGGDREQMRERREERLTKALGLSADQQTKWQSLGQQEHDAVKALHEDTTLPKDQKRAKMEEIRKDFEGQRRAILTPEQQTKFDEIIAKMREHRGGQGQGQGAGAPPPPPPPAPDNK